MATLYLDTTGEGISLRLMCPYEQREVARKIPGANWHKSSKSWSISPNELLVMKVVKELFPQVGMTPQCEQWYYHMLDLREKLKRMKSLEDVDIPWHNAEILRPYQRVDINVIGQQSRILLANDMGTGKTVTSLVASEQARHERILIVSKLVAKDNWSGEIQKWLKSDDLIIIDGTKPKRVKQFTQGRDNFKYTIMHHDLLMLHPELAEYQYDLIIVDEAHRYKNRKAVRTQALYKLTKQCTDLYLLTGTPIKSKFYDVWSLLHMLNPRRYSSFWQFVYMHGVVEDGDYGLEIGNKAKDPELLNLELDPYMIRRMKTDPEVKQYLPDKYYDTMYVEMTNEQRKMYKEMAEDMETEGIVASTVLAKITRLRQIAITPQLITGESCKSPKFEAIIDFIEDYDGKVVIFSMFKQALTLLAKRLQDEDISFTAIVGGTSSEHSKIIQNMFNNTDKYKVMLATIDAAGESVDFTGSSVGIFLDKHWNSTDNEQAEDRLYRTGQKNNVLIMDVVASNSVEGWMNSIIGDKQDLIDSVVNRGHEIIRLIRGK